MKPDPTRKSARRAAAEALARFKPPHSRINLDALLAETTEKQRATDLISTTVRNLAAVDHVIATFSGRALTRIDPPVLAVLRIAACELIYRPQTPDYSIVNDAVQCAKTPPIGGPKQGNFVNAVLRQIQRHIADRHAPRDPQTARSMLPHNTDTGCRFDANILPDPDKDPGEHLSRAFSLPRWLVEEWIEEHAIDRTREICLASNRTPGLYLRPNTLRTTRDDLLATLTAADIDAEPAPDPPLIRLRAHHPIPTLPGYAEGLFTVQDLAAAHAVAMLEPSPGWTILDPCAAPGTKATQLAESTGDDALIIASDIHADRLEQLRSSADRLSLKSIRTVTHNDLPAEIARTAPFDAILLDVPCSNTGVLARRIEVRHRITPHALAELAHAQRQLLETYAPTLKTGGRLAYSTCSIQTVENRRLIDAFLDAHPDFEWVTDRLLLPVTGPSDHDGAYVAILTRN